jgi:hypothetical protein
MASMRHPACAKILLCPGELKCLKKILTSEMRLWALEVLVSNLFAMVCALDGAPGDAFENIKMQMIRGAKSQKFPGMNIAHSELLSAELESAVARLMEMGKTQIQRGVGQRS